MTSLRITAAPTASADVARLLAGGAGARLAMLCERFAGRLAGLRAARRERRSGNDPGSLPPLEPVDGTPAGSRPELPGPLRDRSVEIHPLPEPTALAAALQSKATGVVVDLAAVLPSTPVIAMLHTWLREFLPAQGPRLVVGTRGIDRDEPGILADGHAAPAALVDIALLLQPGVDLHLRLGQLDSPAEAAWMAEVLAAAADAAAVSRPWATIGIDTVPAILAAPGILRALRSHAVALTSDRSAWLRDFLHCFHRAPRSVLPDVSELTDAVHFLRSFGLRLIQLAHGHGIAAIAAPPALLPPAADGEAGIVAALRGDLEREVHAGYDGSAVAHAELMDEVRDVYHRLAPRGDQRHRERSDVRVTLADLLQVPTGKITEHGMDRALREALHGWLAWRRGAGAFDLDGRRVSGAAVALAADQLWQWVCHDTGVLDDGRIVDAELFRTRLDATVAGVDAPAGERRGAAEALAAHVLGDLDPQPFPCQE